VLKTDAYAEWAKDFTKKSKKDTPLKTNQTLEL
jgi:hypothetical protein